MKNHVFQVNIPLKHEKGFPGFRVNLSQIQNEDDNIYNASPKLRLRMNKRTHRYCPLKSSKYADCFMFSDETKDYRKSIHLTF